MDKQTPQPLAGRVALVTGGGRGIGRSTAWELAKLGAAVALLARSHEEVQSVARELTESGYRACAVPADVSDWVQVGDAVQTVQVALGPVDILINNAAVLGPLAPTLATDPAAWGQAMQINITGSYHCLRAVLPGMTARGWGRIVNITSGAAQGAGIENAGAYSVSKAALDMVTRVVAAEAAGTGVCINAVSPGIVDTAMPQGLREAPADEVGEATSARFRGFHARGELQSPALPAQLIAAVALSDAQGEIIRIHDARADALLALLPSA